MSLDVFLIFGSSVVELRTDRVCTLEGFVVPPHRFDGVQVGLLPEQHHHEVGNETNDGQRDTKEIFQHIETPGQVS